MRNVYNKNMKKKMHNSLFLIHNSKKGFTLIELLIVVAIIGILAALLMANFIGVRQRARDAQRKSDIRQVQSALELYRSDTGSYPASLSSCGINISLKSPDGSSTYMQSLPCDPSGTTGVFNSGVYVYSLSGNVYTFGACLETGSNIQATEPFLLGWLESLTVTVSIIFVVKSHYH